MNIMNGDASRFRENMNRKSTLLKTMKLNTVRKLENPVQVNMDMLGKLSAIDISVILNYDY